MYNSDSDSDYEEKRRLKEEQSSLTSNPLIDPLAIAKAFSGTSTTYIVDPEFTNLPPPSKEHREWADKLLNDLTGSAHKERSRARRRSSTAKDEKRSSNKDSGRRSLLVKKSHKKHTSTQDKDSSKYKGSSSSRTKSTDSPSSASLSSRLNESSSSQHRSHSPPPHLGMSFTAAFPPAKASMSTGSAEKSGQVEQSLSSTHSLKKQSLAAVDSQSKSKKREKSPSSGSVRSRHQSSTSPSHSGHTSHTKRRHTRHSRTPSPPTVAERRASYRGDEGTRKKGRSRSRSPIRSKQR